MNKFKYDLRKGSSHIICPKCGKKTFKPYVFAGTNNVVDDLKYGRCERINTCKYIRYPDREVSYNGDYSRDANFQVQHVNKIDFIPPELVENSFHNFKSNVFFMWLYRLFGEDTAYELQEKYNIGTAKNGGTIFWQQDKEGKFRTGKVMYYGDNGRRMKDKKIWYAHRKINPDFSLKQVFFGEHLISENKPVALCESEKTAIVMSHIIQEFTWIAAGGSDMLNLYRLGRINRLDMVFPDNNQSEKWEKKTEMFSGRKIDNTVDIAVLRGELEAGSDILDYYLINSLL